MEKIHQWEKALTLYETSSSSSSTDPPTPQLLEAKVLTHPPTYLPTSFSFPCLPSIIYPLPTLTIHPTAHPPTQVGKLRCLEALGDYPTLLQEAKALQHTLLHPPPPPLSPSEEGEDPFSSKEGGDRKEEGGGDRKKEEEGGGESTTKEKEEEEKEKEWTRQTLLLGSKAACQLRQWDSMASFLLPTHPTTFSSSSSTFTDEDPLYYSAILHVAQGQSPTHPPTHPSIYHNSSFKSTFISSVYPFTHPPTHSPIPLQPTSHRHLSV